jgi:hypothetical protein
MSIPCTTCTCDCEVKSDLVRMLESASSPAADDPPFVALVDKLLDCLSFLVHSGEIATPRALGVALAALFDLCVSLEYAKLITETGWLYCPPRQGEREPLLSYPYVKACPRCAATGSVEWDDDIHKAHKPGSDRIGRTAAKTLGVMLSSLSRRTGSAWAVKQTTREFYDIDMLLFNGDTLALGEVKASPLAAFPVVSVLSREMREQSDMSEQQIVAHHRKTDFPSIASGSVSLYLPHVRQKYALGKLDSGDYPVKAFMTQYAHEPEVVLHVIRAWQRIYLGYERGWRRKQDNRLRYLTFGCGGGVDDSKNSPGIDRTDDIKKGIYQMLKLGEHFVSRCKTGAIKVVLLANVHAVRHHDEYLGSLEDLTWAHDASLHETDDPEWRRVRVSDLIQLYDAAILLTRPHFRSDALASGFGLSKLMKRL